jgi:hypothetical protein
VDDERPSAFTKLAKSLAPGGRLLCANIREIELAACGLKFEGETMQECPLLRGHEEAFKTEIHWREFRRALPVEERRASPCDLPFWRTANAFWGTAALWPPKPIDAARRRAFYG